MTYHLPRAWTMFKPPKGTVNEWAPAKQGIGFAPVYQPNGHKYMISLNADVAKLVDARDLKSPRCVDIKRLSMQTRPAFAMEIDGTKQDLQNKSAPSLAFKWRKTWPDREGDFVGLDGERTIGRIYLKWVPDGERWFWSMQADWEGIDRSKVGLSGIADTAREAASLVEKNYLRSLGGEERQDGLVVGHEPNEDG